MAYRILIASLVLMFLAAIPAQAAVKVPHAESTEMSRAETRAFQKKQRRQKRIERRMERWQKRIAKRSDDKNSNLGLWIIIVGIVLIAGGLLLGIFAFAAPLGGFFYFLAGLGLAFGLVMLIFRLRRGEED
jgi:Flp pilus assembly protein TadB